MLFRSVPFRARSYPERIPQAECLNGAFRTVWSLKGGSAVLTGHQGVQPVHGFLPEVRGLRALVQGLHAGVVPLHLGLMSLGGAVRRFCFAAGAGLGHSCRRSRWEALRRRAPADSYCPGNTQERPGGNSERSAVTVLYRKAEGFTSTARISRYRRITKSDKDSAV